MIFFQVQGKEIELAPPLLHSYTVSELEVRNLKCLEMIEKQNNFDITCLYLQEYKKAFAFLTKFHYFYHKKLTNLTFERRKKKLNFFLGFLSIYDSKTCSNSKKIFMF